MRRNTRRKEEKSFKTLIYVSGSVVLLAIVAFVIGIYAFGNKIKQDAVESQLSTTKIADLVPNTIVNNISTEEASTSFGKTVNQLENTEVNIITENTEDNGTTNETSNEVSEANEENEESQETSTEQEQIDTTFEVSSEPVEEKPSEIVEEVNQPAEDPVFAMPVEGEIIREFAKDKLVYSETLQEWVVHNGIDIKADKTTVVKASAEGKIASIKNDPRYGLTITMEHNNGFKTVYANLLTAEFVTEGEVIEAGQTIGTVGNTATFEILDEPHLHLEIIKDGEYLDPVIYIK